MELLDLLTETFPTRVEWRFAETMPGVQSVMTSGQRRMLE